MNSIDDTNGKITGICKWFNSRMGYGFIVPEDEYDENDADKGTEIFVHFSSITTPEDNGFKTLYRGDKVKFVTAENDKGLEAQQVAIVEKSPRRAKYRKKREEIQDSDLEVEEETEQVAGVSEDSEEVKVSE